LIYLQYVEVVPDERLYLGFYCNYTIFLDGMSCEDTTFSFFSLPEYLLSRSR
jgi:hypothetical protein